MTSYEITDTSTQHIELDHKLEKVGSTKISGFENIWFSCLTNEEVVQYLKEFQPKQYEKCQSIHYELLPNLKNPSITSQFNPKSHEITIWSPIVWEKWFTGKENTKIHILDTIARQVGHNAYENISTSEWKKIHQSQAGFVSTNAKNTEIEDFAESFATYRNDPNLLKFKSPEKYEFMKSQVFFGKEYTTDYEVTPQKNEILSSITNQKERLLNTVITEMKEPIDDLLNKTLMNEKVKNNLAEIITQELQGKLQEEVKAYNTNFNIVDIGEVKATSTKEGFKVESNFVVQHREKLIPDIDFFGIFKTEEMYTPWIAENGSLSVSFSARFENLTPLFQHEKPNLKFEHETVPILGDFISFFKPLFINKINEVIDEKLNDLAFNIKKAIA